MKACETCRDRSSRIGLFGGTFNPIHRGHTQVALDVLRHYQLDCIHFIPSAMPPHKSSGKLASAQDRLHMVRLAVGDYDRLQACDIEVKRSGPSYSVDTVRQLKADSPGQTQFFFILGVDAFLEIHTWKNFHQLFVETAFVVMSRPGTGQWSDTLRRKVGDYVRRHIGATYELSADGAYLSNSNRPTIWLASVTPVDISSSLIRTMSQQGAPVKAWVAPAVAEYIISRGLYR